MCLHTPTGHFRRPPPPPSYVSTAEPGNLSSNFLRSCLCDSTQAAKRGILAPGRGRGLFSRGRGAVRGRGSRGRGRGVPLHAVVDHRPRALEISGFADSDRVDLLPHFAVSQVPVWFHKVFMTFGAKPLWASKRFSLSTVEVSGCGIGTGGHNTPHLLFLCFSSNLER